MQYHLQITNLEITLPAIVETGYDELTKLFNFATLNIQGLVQLFDPEFRLKDFVTKKKSLITDDSETLFEENIELITLIGVTIAIVLILIIIAIAVKRARDIIKKKLSNSVKAYIFNGHMNTYTLFFIKQHKAIKTKLQ